MRFRSEVSWLLTVDLQRILVGKVALGVCAIIGGVMALAYADVLPDVALVVGIPALVATILVDTFLYNTFRIETGVLVWGFMAGFVYLESVAIGLLIRWVRSRRNAGESRR